MMTMTKMINNDNKLHIILGVLHLSYHSGTTLKREEQYHEDNQTGSPPHSERASGLTVMTIDHDDNDQDDYDDNDQDDHEFTYC